MNIRLNFDWKDGWLVALGFGVAVAIASALRAQDIELSRGLFHSLVVACIFLPPAARRKIFGSPTLGRRRDGILWVLCSTLGLLTMFFGIGALWLSAVRMSSAQEEPPNFLEEELAYLDAPSPLGEILAFQELENSSASLMEERRAKERKVAEKEARARATERRAEWARSAKENTKKTWLISAVASALLLFGSVCISLRYESPRSGLSSKPASRGAGLPRASAPHTSP